MNIEDRDLLEDNLNLKKIVSVKKRSIFLEDLLIDLSKISEVTIYSKDSDWTAGLRVFINVSGIPVFHVMKGLVSLFSYQGAELRWVKELKGKQVSYRLLRPEKSRFFPDLLEQEIYQDAENKTEEAIKYLDAISSGNAKLPLGNEILESLIGHGF